MFVGQTRADVEDAADAESVDELVEATEDAVSSLASNESSLMKNNGVCVTGRGAWVWKMWILTYWMIYEVLCLQNWPANPVSYRTRPPFFNTSQGSHLRIGVIV